MKFSFIHTGIDVELPETQREKAPASWPPLGILYVATFLRENGVEVSVLDQAAKALSLQDSVNWVGKEDPDILGFSTLSSSGKTAAKIAERIKEENPNVKIVFGNYHATFSAERILKKYPFVDVIVKKEGELTALELTESLEKRADLEEVHGISFRKNGRIVSTPERPLMKDIDSLPFPDRELLDIEYCSTMFGLDLATERFTTVLTSRGCPYRCSFCGCMKLARGVWRPRSVENVLEELKMLNDKGYKQVLFVDDNFTLNQRRLFELCERIRKEKIDMEWICESRVDNCSTEMFKLMVRAGCRVLYLGIESANQRILDYYNKGTTPEQSQRAVKAARKAGVDVIIGTFIVGAPDETREEILNTLKFAQKLDIDIPQFNILYAFPGIDIWDELVKRGVLNEELYWENGVCVPEIFPGAVPFEDIRSMIQENFKGFFLRSGYILPALLRTLKSPYRAKAVINGLRNADKVIEGFHEASKSF